MTGFPILDVVIGLAFVYLLLALICTTVMEWIAQLRNMRGKMLELGTRRLLGEEAAENPVITNAYFEHPLIQTLGDGKRRPSYIPGPVFAKALRDVLAKHAPSEGSSPASSRLRGSLQALGATGDQQVGEGTLPDENALGGWYDQLMDRVSGTYKRQTRVWVLALAVGVTILMNADTVTLAGNLWQSPTLRAYVVDLARVRVEQGPPLETVEYTEPTAPTPTPPITKDTTRTPDALLPEEQALLGQLFGWSSERASFEHQGPLLWLLRHLIGWSLTALAVSLGAPFWFDTLNRFMSLRASGRVPPKTGETTKAGGR